jgi:hypothetical protein
MKQKESKEEVSLVLLAAMVYAFRGESIEMPKGFPGRYITVDMKKAKKILAENGITGWDSEKKEPIRSLQ